MKESSKRIPNNNNNNNNSTTTTTTTTKKNKGGVIALLLVCMILSLSGLRSVGVGRFAPPRLQFKEASTVTTTTLPRQQQQQQLLLQGQDTYYYYSVVPFDAYNECNNAVLHVNCNTTLQDLAGVMVQQGYLAWEPSLRDTLCSTWLPTETPEQRQYTLPLCYQTASQAGVIVQHDTLPPQKTATSVPSLATTDQAVALVHQVPASTSSTTATVRVLHLVRLHAFGLYYPDSTRGLEIRQKDANIGNMIWQWGATAMLNPLTYRQIQQDESSSSLLPDATLIATANALALDNNTQMNNFVSHMIHHVALKYQAPTVVLGIGVQGEFEDFDAVQNIQLSALHYKFLSAVAERQSQPAIGVRGDYTRIGCQSVNITNCISMGCPSLTIHRAPHLGAVLEEKLLQAKEKLKRGERLKIGMALPAINNPKKKATYDLLPSLMNFTLNLASVHDVKIVVQMGYDRVNVQKFQKTFQQQHAKTKYELKKYDSVQPWKQEMEQQDIMLSMRIHGGMGAVMAGTPAIVIPTDLRIMELVNAMHIPHLTMDQITKTGNDVSDPKQLLQLLESIQYGDFDAFERNRRDKIAKWKGILDSAGIEMDPGLLQIIQSDDNLMPTTT